MFESGAALWVTSVVLSIESRRLGFMFVFLRPVASAKTASPEASILKVDTCLVPCVWFARVDYMGAGVGASGGKLNEEAELIETKRLLALEQGEKVLADKRLAEVQNAQVRWCECETATCGVTQARFDKPAADTGLDQENVKQIRDEEHEARSNHGLALFCICSHLTTS